MIEDLNRRFRLANRCRIAEGRSGQQIIQLRSPQSRGEIYLQGGHVSSWKPSDGEDVLWLSAESRFEPGQAIRGGIPICWPWFGAHPTEDGWPSHGYVRKTAFTLERSFERDDGAVGVNLVLDSSGVPSEYVPQAVELRVEVVMGEALEVAITTENRSDANICCTAALHTYLRVGDVSSLVITGFEGLEYLDKPDAFARKRQVGRPVVDGYVDRIYLQSAEESERDCVVEDPALGRCLRVGKEGSRSTVLWNPWTENAKAMEDFESTAFPEMLCVEAANAADDAVEIAPGGSHRLSTRISVEPLPAGES